MLISIVPAVSFLLSALFAIPQCLPRESTIVLNLSPKDGGRACFESIYGPPKGGFLETTHGTTHYILQGTDNNDEKKNDPLVVLIHGIGGHTEVFDPVTDNLVKTGARVLRYDLYDRGYSESDKTKYPIEKAGVHSLDFTLEMHIEQLEEVLSGLNLIKDSNIILCGHSTGGAVAMGYAAGKPNNVKGLVLIDSVCLPMKKPLTARVADFPIIGGFLVRMFGAKSFNKFSRNSVANPEQMEDFLQKQAENVLNNPRFLASVRSTNSHCKGFVGSAEEEFRSCCRAKIPIHLIWGKEDTSVPYEHCLRLKAIADELGTAVTEEPFDGMPHNVFFPDAKPSEVSISICSFVNLQAAT